MLQTSKCNKGGVQVLITWRDDTTTSSKHEVITWREVVVSSQIYRFHGFVSFTHECHALFKHRSCVHDFRM
jgi:hypothetical protein